jgi:hypothetical protein
VYYGPLLGISNFIAQLIPVIMDVLNHIKASDLETPRPKIWILFLSGFSSRLTFAIYFLRITYELYVYQLII